MSAISTLIEKRRLYFKRQKGTKEPGTNDLLARIVTQLEIISRTMTGLYDIKRMKQGLMPDIAILPIDRHPDPPFGSKGLEKRKKKQMT